MDLKKIEDQVLDLDEETRIKLIQKLVLSLESPSSSELQEHWLDEAQRRAAELDSGAVQAVPGAEVIRKARAAVR